MFRGHHILSINFNLYMFFWLNKEINYFLKVSHLWDPVSFILGIVFICFLAECLTVSVA